MKKTEMEYLQQSFLRMLTEGDYKYSDDELVTWCKNLQLPLLDKSLFCVVVKAADAVISAEDTARTKQQCERIIANWQLQGYVVIGRNMDVILILADYERFSHSDFQKLLKAISQRLERPVRLGVGKGRRELTKLHASKVEAYEALALSDSQILVADVRDLYIVRDVPSGFEEKSRKEIIERFRKGELQTLETELTELAEYVRANTVIKPDAPYPSTIRRTMIELLVEMMHIASAAGVDVDEAIEYVDPYRKIFELTDTPLIIHWITDVAQVLYNAMNNRQEKLENQLLYHVKVYIEEHLSDLELCLSSVSQFVGMSPGYFSAFFIREAGMGFKEYVTAERIKLAQKLLHESKESINMISEYCGFLSPSYFISVFKNQTGMTPGAYRKLKN